MLPRIDDSLMIDHIIVATSVDGIINLYSVLKEIHSYFSTFAKALLFYINDQGKCLRFQISTMVMFTEVTMTGFPFLEI